MDDNSNNNSNNNNQSANFNNPANPNSAVNIPGNNGPPASCCTLNTIIKGFAVYYLTLNFILFIVTIVFQHTSSSGSVVWFWCFLVAVLVNLLLSIGALAILFYGDYFYPAGGAEAGAGGLASRLPTDEQSQSFKTVLTINSAVPGLTPEQLAKLPPQAFVNLTPNPAQNNPSPGGSIVIDMKKKKAHKNSKDPKTGGSGKQAGGGVEASEGAKESDDQTGTGKAAEKETNFAAIPSDVLAKELKEKKEAKEKKEKRHSKDKKGKGKDKKDGKVGKKNSKEKKDKGKDKDKDKNKDKDKKKAKPSKKKVEDNLL